MWSPSCLRAWLWPLAALLLLAGECSPRPADPPLAGVQGFSTDSVFKHILARERDGALRSYVPLNDLVSAVGSNYGQGSLTVICFWSHVNHLFPFGNHSSFEVPFEPFYPA